MVIFATAWHLREQTVTGQRCKSRTPGSEEKNKSDHQQVNTKGERERKGRESGWPGDLSGAGEKHLNWRHQKEQH